MSPDDLKALTFDVFGTVVDWRGSLIAEFRPFGKDNGLAVDWDRFVDEWRSGSRNRIDAVRTGTLPWANLDELCGTQLDELLKAYGIRGLDEGDKNWMNRAWHRLKPWQDSVSGLTRLKKKFVTATLSNGSVACMVNMAKHAGLPWDCVLSAEIFHHYKPDAQVYRGAVELLGLQPHQVMMVAAHNYDLHAARTHGLQTAFVARPAEKGPRQTSDLKPEEDWDVAASSLEELALALGA
jgi:2-haloacid dehalogenase